MMKLRNLFKNCRRRMYLCCCRRIRFWLQRRVRKFSDDELWSLDVTIAKFILPRLRRFKQKNDSHPSTLSEKEWNKKLDEMIYSFSYYARGEQRQYENTEESKSEQKQAIHGLRMFAQWYGHLWI